MAKEEGQRQLAAIVFTDMVGYASMAQKNESLALELLEEQRRILRSVFPKYDGEEIKTIGDGFLLEFASALQAARCAVEIQRTIEKRNSSATPERKIQVRIGIHVGDVIRSRGDIVGDGVNIASRIEPLAQAGGICISRQVYDQIQNKLEYGIAPLGTRQLKHIETPVEVFEIALAKGAPLQRPKPYGKHRIAVLPLANISLEPKEDYFADGMTEELISTLSKIAGLRVIARTSVMRYKGSTKSISEVGKELGVENVVEGSVRKAHGKIRITTQLVSTETEEPLWSQEYDRDMRDIFAIQSDIAQRIAKALKVQVLRAEKQGIEKEATQNLEAYNLYLRGRYFWNKRTEEGLESAIGYFKAALRNDRSFALAYTGLADSYAMLALLELSPPREAFPKAKAAAERALKIDSQLAEAHTSLAVVRFQYERDWLAAEAEFKLAIELSPNYAPAHNFYANFLKAMGRFDEALSEAKRAEELDPLDLAINTGVGHVLYLSRNYDKAIEQYGKTLELDPNFAQAHLWFGRPYLQKGMYKEAIHELQKAVALSAESTMALATLGHAYASAGNRSGALLLLDKLKRRSKSQYVPSYWIATIYNGLGDKDKAFAWLERAYLERSSWLSWVKVEPRFDLLHSDPRFLSLLKRMKLV